MNKDGPDAGTTRTKTVAADQSDRNGYGGQLER